MSLHPNCPVCEGSGYIYRPASIDPSSKMVRDECPECKGTGFNPRLMEAGNDNAKTDS